MIANGDMIPNMVMGTLNSIRIERNEPTITAVSNNSTADAAFRRTGLATIGTNPEAKAAQARIW